MNRNRGFLGQKSGFTLIEMILVIGLIVLLAGVAIFRAGGIFGNQQVKMTELAVKETFKPVLFSYRMDVGSYPSSEQGLRALVEKPAGDRGRWRGPYVESEEKLVDAWGNEFKYRFPSTVNPGGYELYSLGPDGVESEDDIRNW